MKIKMLIVISGYAFLIFGISDFIIKVSLFGFRALDFLWFCSITLFLLGLGMVLKSDVLLISFLSIALLVQPFWMFDYAWLAFFNIPLNGVSSFVFKPGYSLVQFILNVRHMYMIPFGFFAVFVFSRKNKASYLFTAAFAALLLGSSYIFAPRDSNLNCVFEPCLQIFRKLNGFTYFFLYTIVIMAISLTINLAINKLLQLFGKIENKKHYWNFILALFLFLIFISTITVAFAFLKHSNTPKISCLKPDVCNGCALDIKCSYIDTDTDNLSLIYSIKNYGDKGYVCDIFMKIYPIDGQFSKIANNSFIESGKKYRVGQFLPYPSADSQIKLKLNCSLIFIHP